LKRTYDKPFNTHKAKKLLKKTAYNVKTAIIMARLKVEQKEAEGLLKKHKGFLKNIIE